jgi:hypothetical protein
MDNVLNAGVTVPFFPARSVNFDLAVAQGGARRTPSTLSFEGRLFKFPETAGGR